MSDEDDITKAFKQEERFRLIQTQIQSENEKQQKTTDTFVIFKANNTIKADKQLLCNQSQGDFQ